MAIKKDKVDAVLVGFGWTGAILGQELTEAGLQVLALERGGQRFDAIWFGHDESLPEQIQAAYRLEQNVWNGMVTAQLVIEYAGPV